MSVVDLGIRVTQEWDKYNEYVKSNDSLIYIAGEVILKDVGPASLNVTVGEKWHDLTKGKVYKIPESGIKVKPGENILVETAQRIALPNNVFGVLYGTGKNIFRGGFISSGKINPGFNGCLKVGYYNGNKRTICFKPGDLLACCTFFNMETTTSSALEYYLDTPEPELLEPNSWVKMWTWIKKNWYAIISVCLSTIAIIVTIWVG